VNHRLLSVNEVRDLIRSGRPLLLAGDEAALRQLPPGPWIAGTIPYFMTASGGMVDRERVFVTELPEGLRCAGIRRYRGGALARVYTDLPADGFGVIIVPASSRAHLSFALDAPTYEGFATRPLIGWVSGVHLSELGKATPKVFDGTTAEALAEDAVVMHVSLPRGAAAEIDILNIFTEGEGPALTFPSTGFTATQVDIDGRRQNLAEYLRASGIDTRLPLVASYCGTNVNVSFQEVDAAHGEVRFYAPVFAGVTYRHARPVADYVTEFTTRLPHGVDRKIAFSCNCILNYLHSGLEGRTTGGIAGPITFGEIGYQLLNQTMAYLTIERNGT
jgi:hypothetical protein